MVTSRSVFLTLPILFVGVVGFWIGQQRGVAEGIAQGRATVPGATLITNVDDDGYVLTPLRWVEGVRQVYDVRVIAVSKAYAELIGYKYSERIMDLPPGLLAAEFQMITEGEKVSCYYRFMLDSSLPLDLPSIDQGSPNPSRLSISTRKRQSPEIEKVQQERFRFKNYYDRNVYLTTERYDPANRKPPYIKTNPMLWSLQRDHWPGIHLIELYNGAGACDLRLHTYPNTALWLKKVGGHDYTQRLHPDRNDFYIFTLPESWWREGAEVLQAYEQVKQAQRNTTKGD